MLLEKYENLLKLCYAVSNIVKFTKFDFLWSDYMRCVKHQMSMLLVVKLGTFRIQHKLYKPKSNLISFQR